MTAMSTACHISNIYLGNACTRNLHEREDSQCHIVKIHVHAMTPMPNDDDVHGRPKIIPLTKVQPCATPETPTTITDVAPFFPSPRPWPANGMRVARDH